MFEKQYASLLVIPFAMAIASVLNQGTGGPEPPAKPTLAKPTNSPTADPAKQNAWPMKTACHVLADYFDVQAPEPTKAKSVKISITDESGKVSKLTIPAQEEPEEPKCDDVLKDELSRIEALKQVEALFVFIPDPNSSSLSLETDRSLDSIRRAFNEKGFIPYRTNILPWKPIKVSADGKGGEQKLDPKDADRPGVWLFRDVRPESNELKLVFLIGDSPIAGISKAQFHNAVSQWKQLHPIETFPKLAPLQIVGPVFSGSVKSLGIALKTEITSSKKDNWIDGINAVSGTAELNNLQTALRSAAGDPPDFRIELKQLAKTNALDKLLAYMPSGKKAVLSEGDTAFGSAAFLKKSATNDEIEHFSYSRDLLNLRSAYESDSDLMSRIFPKSLHADQLPLHFGSSHSPADALSIFAPHNSAVSQQLSLRHFASSLHRRRFNSLIIVGSDSLDWVFLARFFQEAAPNLRLGVLDSDVLLDREAGSVSLRGVLTISQQPTGAVANKQIEHPGGTAFGIYRATKSFLLSKDEILEMPATVISVVGFDGEWPLKVYCPDTIQSSEPDPWKFVHTRSLIAFLVLLSLLTIVPGIAHFFLKDQAHNQGKYKPAFELMQILYPFSRGGATHATGLELERLSWLRLLPWTGVLALIVPFVPAVMEPTSGKVFPAVFARYLSFSDGISPILPLCALLLGIHACVWSRVRCCYLAAYSYYPKPSPLPASKESSPKGKDEDEEVAILLEAVDKGTTRFFGWSFWIWLCLSIIVAILYDLRIFDVEAHSFRANPGIWTILFCLLGALAVNTIWRFGALWMSLQRLLRRLEYHPLRTGFTNLPDRVSWTSIWSIGGLRPTMVGLQMTADFLSAISGKREVNKTTVESIKEETDLRSDIDTFMSKVHTGKFLSAEGACADLSKIKKNVVTICGNYITQLSGGAWDVERIEGWRHSAEAEKKDSSKSTMLHFPLSMKTENGATTTIEKVKVTDVNDLNNLKAQFVALQYAAFIRYAFMQLRNLLGYLGISLTLLFIALNVYPFQPISTMTNFATLLFALAAVTVISTFYLMDRDPLLSRLSNTEPGKLDSGFGVRLLQFGALPTITFLATHFPVVGTGLMKLAQLIPGLAKL